MTNAADAGNDWFIFFKHKSLRTKWINASHKMKNIATHLTLKLLLICYSLQSYP